MDSLICLFYYLNEIGVPSIESITIFLHISQKLAYKSPCRALDCSVVSREWSVV